MAGIKALRKIQMGQESTAGTAVAATTLWRGMGTIEDARTVEVVEEDIGLLMPTNRSYIPKLEATLSMDSTPATFQQLLHILNAGIKAVAGVQDGTGSDYVYTYPFPTTSAPTIKTYTLEGGDNQQAEEMEYSFVESFKLEGSAGEALMMSADWRGRQVVNTTFTAAIAIPAVEEILVSKGKVYIDDVGSGFGNTLISDTLLSFSLEVTTGLVAKFTMEGDLFFSFLQNTRPEVKLSMTFEHNSTSVLEKTDWRANTPRAVQLIFEGTAFGTPGTTYTYHTLILELPGVYESFSSLGDTDGNDTYDVEMIVGYDETLASAGQIILVNELTTIP